MKKFLEFFSVMIVFALVAGLAPKAEAADTKDVIAGVILGGIIGNQIGKSNYGYSAPLPLQYPHGTIIINQPRIQRGYSCHFELDNQGYPIYATPTCYRQNTQFLRGSTSVMRLSNNKRRMKEDYPCGSYWGYGCRHLIEDLKTGKITGIFDFSH